MAKESLVVNVQKLLFKKYLKNHKINFFFFFNKVEEKKITKEELIHLLSFKKIYIYIYIYWSLHCFYSIHDYQCLSLTLSWTC